MGEGGASPESQCESGSVSASEPEEADDEGGVAARPAPVNFDDDGSFCTISSTYKINKENQSLSKKRHNFRPHPKSGHGR